MGGYRDRTADFFNEVARVTGEDKAQLERAALIPKAKGPVPPFTVAAQSVARKIALTAGKLKNLAALAKKKSLFDDPTVDFNEQSFIIKKSIRELQAEVEGLENMYGKSKTSQVDTHNANVVGCLDASLGKTVKEFSSILEERSHNIQEQQKHRKTLVGSTPSGSGNHQYLSIFQEAEKGDDFALELEQVQSTEMRQYDYQEGRLSEVQTIEKVLVELHGIFSKMNELIMEHDVTIGRLVVSIFVFFFF